MSDNQREMLNKHGFRFNKQFGQNFISDKNLLSAIVADAGVTATDTVVEVGAGAGALTVELAAVAKKVISYEIDKNLKSVLEEKLEGINNVELIFADALKESEEEILRRTGGEFKLVANLPYYITTPLIFKFLEMPVKSVTVLVQKEVAERMCAHAGDDAYGVLSIGIALFGTARITRIVKRQMFYPVPDVDSALVTITFDSTLSTDERKAVRELAKVSFAMRRKTLYNNLRAKYGSDTAQAALERAGIDAGARAETLTLSDYIKLSEVLTEIVQEK